MPLDAFQSIFEAGIPELRARLMHNFSKFENRGGYKVVWEEFEDEIYEGISSFLVGKIPGLSARDIAQTQTKSSYPDFKISYRNKLYAIDIKSGADDKAEPWYDMGRLDTFEEGHTDKFAAEYYITVRYSRTAEKDGPILVNDLYIEPFYQSVGIREECQGVLYRPYDGKLRPKSWHDFATGKAYWKTLDAFLIGLARSRSHRRMQLIRDWIGDMSSQEKEQLRRWLQS